MPYYRSKKYRSGNRVYNTELAISEVGVRQIRSEEQSIHQLMRMSASQVYWVELIRLWEGTRTLQWTQG